ncbi:hypothetical protein F4818DRAFT_437126 [Hypoxylon cercidicola]|nr:hypothetical protein F4818DRAFT_437126 [Hypoxylon cercidicola]
MMGIGIRTSVLMSSPAVLHSWHVIRAERHGIQSRHDEPFSFSYPRLLSAFETCLAPPIASIVHARILEDSTLGIALLNNTTLTVAAMNKRLVNLYAIPDTAQTSPSFKLESSIWLHFLPDNLSVSEGDGALLIAGHPHLPNKFACFRRICHRPDVLAAGRQQGWKMCATTGGIEVDKD